ncbi:unnamed protein product [Gongylonema pulchrum]|uniref:Uncharacterized protein n=1 Tax=Gongylonema pulchrum TaxID=637853 RepID=A0A183CVN1_9BILA|nr:unnamed protein product [Gongylonema pulchrum]
MDALDGSLRENIDDECEISFWIEAVVCLHGGRMDETAGVKGGTIGQPWIAAGKGQSATNWSSRRDM